MKDNKYKVARSLAALFAVFCLGVFVMAQQPRQTTDTAVKVVKEWNGGSPDKKDNDLWKQVPQGGVITGPNAWSKLWKAWHGTSEAPKVDFDKELILVAAGSGPNIIKMDDLILTGKGNLLFTWGITEKFGDGFVYTILKINRESIKLVNGKEFPVDVSDTREIPLKSFSGLFPGVEKPTRITSADELAKAFPGEDQIAKKVDFTKEHCLFFAWKGSGMDKLSVKITSHVKDGKEVPVVEVTHTIGQTDDLRRHCRLFVIPKNATWPGEK